MKLFVASSLLVAGYSGRTQVAAAHVSPASSKNNISKKGERRLGKGVSSIDTTVGTASSNKPKTKSTTSKSLVSDILDVGILSNHEDTEFDEVFTWVDHDAAPTRGRGGGRRRRHRRKNGSRHRHKQNQNLSRHKDKLLAKLHGSKISHTNNDINIIDTDIMQMDIARVDRPTTCDQGYVNCTNGIVEESGETCAEACGEECCDGEDACTRFTGLICKDDYSCKGEASCFYANIEVVVNGCNGNEACLYAGYDGLIGAVRNGCVGTGACLYAASYGGSIEGIEDSCNGEGSCELAAVSFIDDDNLVVYGGGTIGMIKSSCNGEDDFVCYNLASANGTIGDIVNSCEGYSACAFTASYGGNIEEIEDSCLDGEFSCAYAAAGYIDDGAYEGGRIGKIISSCIGGDSSCFSLAFDGVVVGGVRDSCDGFYACNYAASYGGSIESIIDLSCSGSEACNFTASNGGRIESITNSSCAGSNACSYAASCDANENDSCKAGRIGNITNSCEEEKSCYKMADEGGYVNDVFMSCVGESSCERAAFNGSISLGIVNACRAERACEGLGEDSDIESQVNSCCNTKDECGLDSTSLPSECSMVTTQSPSKAPSSSPSRMPSSSPSMSPLPPTPSPTNSPSSAPTSAAPTVSLGPTLVMSSKSAKSKGRKSKQSKKSKSAKALSMNLTTSDEDDSKIRRKRIRKHAPGASGKLSSLSGSDEQ